MLKLLALAAIRFYQRYLSPLKGYSCAYRVYAKGCSCSAFGHQAIQKHGLAKGLFLLRRRMDKCAWHYIQHTSKLQSRTAYQMSQGGFCDAAELAGAACEPGALHCGEAIPSLHGCAPDVGECMLNGACQFGPDIAAWGCGDSCADSCSSGPTSAAREEDRRKQRESRRG